MIWNELLEVYFETGSDYALADLQMARQNKLLQIGRPVSASRVLGLYMSHHISRSDWRFLILVSLNLDNTFQEKHISVLKEEEWFTGLW